MGARAMERNLSHLQATCRHVTKSSPAVTPCHHTNAVIGLRNTLSEVIDGHDPPRPVRLTLRIPETCKKSIATGGEAQYPRTRPPVLGRNPPETTVADATL